MLSHCVICLGQLCQDAAAFGLAHFGGELRSILTDQRGICCKESITRGDRKEVIHMKKVKMPSITIMLWEHQLSLLIRALRAYEPTDKGEEMLRQEELDMLETIAADR
jgi:hypothetical protein